MKRALLIFLAGAAAAPAATAAQEYKMVIDTVYQEKPRMRANIAKIAKIRVW